MSVETMFYILIGLLIGLYGILFNMNGRLGRLEGVVLNGSKLIRATAFDSKPKTQEDNK